MALVEIVHAICNAKMQEEADQICADYKRAVHATVKYPHSTGEAEGSIHVEKLNEGSYRIGAANLHLFFFEMGNNQKYRYFGGKRNPAAPNGGKSGGAMRLRYTDGSVHQYSHTYKGRNVKAKVAAKYGG